MSDDFNRPHVLKRIDVSTKVYECCVCDSTIEVGSPYFADSQKKRVDLVSRAGNRYRAERWRTKKYCIGCGKEYFEWAVENRPQRTKTVKAQ